MNWPEIIIWNIGFWAVYIQLCMIPEKILQRDIDNA